MNRIEQYHRYLALWGAYMAYYNAGLVCEPAKPLTFDEWNEIVD